MGTKTLVALAALSAVSAFAQVTLSGRASMDVSTFQTKNATTATDNISRRTRVADTGSRITFAANEDLGGGVNAGVYCETGINIDSASNYGQADTTNPNTTTFCSREGRAYIGNSTGEIRLGRQNVWWTQGELNQIGSNYLGTDTLTNLINGGVGVYTTRGENMVKLVAGPQFGAFAGSEVYQGFMGHSGSDGYATNVTGESANSGDGKYYGFKLNYSQGQYVAMIDDQASRNSPTSAVTLLTNQVGTVTAANGVTAASYKRNAIKYGLGYKYGGESLISLQAWNKNRTPMADGGEQQKQTGWGIAVHHDLGAGYVLSAQYGKDNKREYGGTTAQSENGASGYTLGGLKRLSKRTHVIAAYHVLNNGSAGTYNMSGGNYSSAAGVGAGSQVKMMALGMIHNF